MPKKLRKRITPKHYTQGKVECLDAMLEESSRIDFDLVAKGVA